MSENIKHIYTIVIIASLAASAYAIRCYRCESDYDSDCKNPGRNGSMKFLCNCDYIPAPSYIRDDYGSDPPATGCMEKTVKTDGGRTSIIRSCYFGDISDQDRGCQNPPWKSYETLSCFVCDYNECNDNSSSESYPSYSVSSGSTVTGSIYVMFTLFFAMMHWE